ncbi:endonuclease/exonuclease/phosphatase family protein [Moheibacter lacus]|uniref:Endonuclease n=1 Tax=Moheibacter lacus TaxID=2745851 RepID=A0A838ZN59_9FLAO|nr:endonuclease [Moheibacter lacus]MBA5629330.1 endonuclease [Moheibacter lacus]
MSLGSIAFYNTENFFDVIDDPEKFENEYSPEGSRKWTQKRYENKVWKIGSVISELGLKETGNPPLIVGLAEVENDSVLRDLVRSEHLVEHNYGFIHFESRDERGIDNAILYRKDWVKVIHAEPLAFSYLKPPDFIAKDFSRDVLYVQFQLGNHLFHSFVLHLPSRRDLDVNREFRNIILKEIKSKVNEILGSDPEAQIILMGDFNGNPNDVDALEILKSSREKELGIDQLFNPMLEMFPKKGSLKHNGRWILFDQLLFSKSFLDQINHKIRFESAHIYNDRSVQDWDRRFKGSPFRTFAGSKYLGGYSDHFPVFAIINY